MMKRLFIIAVITIFSAATVQAQNVEFGAKAGLNFASLSGDDVDDLDGLTGFHLGLVADIAVSNRFSIQPEVLYSAQGASGDDDSSINLDYISVPIMAKIYLMDALSVQLGPQFAFNTRAQTEFDGVSEDLEDVEGMDIGAGLGLGYEFGNLFVQGRYNFGFSDIMEDLDAKNSVLQLSLGYMF